MKLIPTRPQRRRIPASCYKPTTCVLHATILVALATGQPLSAYAVPATVSMQVSAYVPPAPQVIAVLKTRVVAVTPPLSGAPPGQLTGLATTQTAELNSFVETYLEITYRYDPID